GLRPEQQALVTQWESTAQRLGQPEIRYQEVKDPATAAWLGLLPGVGGFYTHRPGIAVAGVLTGPIRIAWGAASAHSSAYDYNFGALRDRMIDLGKRQAAADELNLERQVLEKQIPAEVFQARRERLQRCSEELEKERGLPGAVHTPGAINSCLNE